VAQVVLGAPMLLRRARGYVPRPLALARPVALPVLACGAQLKNAFCLATGEQAFLSPHVGDLENLQTFAAYEAAIERALRFTGVRPEVIAHDLHPDYLSTGYARRRPEEPKVAVQHHHAHVVAAMAEHGLRGPVIGVAYDGAGYGPDGSLWGGELLLAREAGFERLATLRPIPLAGGDLAVRQPWRTALALLDDACGQRLPLDALALFDSVAPAAIALARRMVKSRLNAPAAHGLGRYFDALGALGLGRPLSAHEGQLALEWNLLADSAERRRYGFEIDWGRAPWTVDLRPMVREVVSDLFARVPTPLISARFHNALVAATAATVRRARRDHGALPVVLAGGCFQNRRLAEGVVAALGAEVTVRLPRLAPPGDGGIALGQAVVADAVLRGSA
jgi:hydrogenase maturation protein HypF